MEGLIPMVYKAMKRNKTRSQYRCLSKGNAQTYNIDDFYTLDDDDDRVGKFYSPQIETRGGFEGRRGGHRRSMSTGGYKIDGGELHDEGNNNNNNGGFSISTPDPDPDPDPPNMQLKRFRSHRMFSCVTGAT